MYDVHLAAYCLDPAYWNHDHYSMNEVMEAFRKVVPKIFHFRDVPEDSSWVEVVVHEYRSYKNKIGELSSDYVNRAASTMSPTEFYESYGSSIPNLTFMAKKIFGICLANECSELNWHHFKLNRTKGRSLLKTETVHKLITVQSVGVLRENLIHDYRKEMSKWTEADEICKLSKDINESRAVISVRFLNFLEQWEFTAKCTKNKAHEDLLLHKYQHVYFFDEEHKEIRRVAGIEWKTKVGRSGVDAQHTCLSILVKRTDDENGNDHEFTDDDDETYFINDDLHEMIKAAPAPYNDRLLFVADGSL